MVEVEVVMEIVVEVAADMVLVEVEVEVTVEMVVEVTVEMEVVVEIEVTVEMVVEVAVEMVLVEVVVEVEVAVVMVVDVAMEVVEVVVVVASASVNQYRRRPSDLVIRRLWSIARYGPAPQPSHPLCLTPSPSLPFLILFSLSSTYFPSLLLPPHVLHRPKPTSPKPYAQAQS